MTTTIQTSAMNIQFNSRKNRKESKIYNCVVNGEDGNYQEFEIEAENDMDAHSKADSIAQNCMVDIAYIEVYRMS